MKVFGIDPSLTACGISDGVHHAIIATKPHESEDAITGLSRRSSEIASGILRFIGEHSDASSSLRVFIEAPMFRTAGNAGNHLFDVGWLMRVIFEALIAEHGAIPNLVPTLTVKKFASGKGNTKKDQMKLAVYKKWGIEFDRDPGCDKLHAFVLAKYGQSVLLGETDAPIIRRRGRGQRKKVPV